MHLLPLSPRWRRAFLFMLCLLLAILALPLFDLAPLREKVQRDVQNSLGRKIEIGALRLALLPRPSVTLDQVNISEPDGRALFAQFESARFSLAWAALFKLQAELQDARIEGLQLGINAQAGGALNIDDLLKRPNRATPINWRLQRIDLVGAKVDWRGQDGEVLRLRNLQLHALNPDQENGAVTLKGQLQAPHWGGGLRVDSRLRLHDNGQSALLRDFKLAINAQTPEWQAGHAEFNGELRLQALPWRAELTDARGRATVKRGQQLWQLGFKTPALSAAESGLSTGQLDAQFGVKGSDIELSGGLQVAQLAADASGSLVADTAMVNLQLLNAEQNTQLQLQSPLRIEGWRKLRLENLQLSGAYRHKALPRGAIALSMQGRAALDLEKERFDYDGEGTLDGAAMDAQFSLEDFIQPRYAFGLNLARLDLSPYLPVAAQEVPLDPKQPWHLENLKQLNARGEIRLGELDIGRFRLFNLHTRLSAADRQIKLDPLQADVYGGRLDGRLLLDLNKQPHLQLNQRLAGLEATALLSDLFEIDRLAGRGQLNLDLNAPATSWDALRRGLSGRVDAQLTHGTMIGFDLGQTLRDWRGKLAELTGTAIAPDAKRRTQFSDLSARLVFKDGVAQSRDLSIRAPFMQIKGEGLLDIGAGQLDYRLRATLSGGSGVPELDALKGTEIPINIKGSLLSPTYRVDTTALKARLVQ